MEYLIDLGFDEEILNNLKETLPAKAIEILGNKKEKVIANVTFLKSLGISNYIAAFMKFYNMFLLDEATFEEIFSKYDKEDLIAKLEKNVAIMEYL